MIVITLIMIMTILRQNNEQRREDDGLGWVHLCMITNMIMMTTIMLILIIMMLIIMMITIIMITIMTIEMMMSEGDRWVGLAPPFYPIILKFDLMIMIATIQRQ